MFLAIKHYLNPVGQPELDSESEIIWAKIDLPGLKMFLFAHFISQGDGAKKSAVAHPIHLLICVS